MHPHVLQQNGRFALHPWETDYAPFGNNSQQLHLETKMHAFVRRCCLFQYTDTHHEQQQTQDGHSVETGPGCRSRISSFLNLLEESRTEWSWLAPRGAVFWLCRAVLEVVPVVLNPYVLIITFLNPPRRKPDNLLRLVTRWMTRWLIFWFQGWIRITPRCLKQKSFYSWHFPQRTSNRNRRLTNRPAWGLPRVQSQP